MKTRILLLFVLISSYSFAQSINDYKAVVIPTKYAFMKEDNQYRLATFTKANLSKAGFTSFYSNEELPQEYIGQRCNLLNIDVIKDNGFLITKLYVVFKDCYGQVVYTSEIGKSKIKEYDGAYKEALDLAFVSINALHYKYNGATFSDNAKTTYATLPNATKSVATSSPVAVVAPAVSSAPVSSVGANSADVLYAQPTETGYQLIDKTPKIVMKLMKTSRPDSFIAIKDGVQGNLILKDNQWFFEYYKDDKMMTEPIAVKF